MKKTVFIIAALMTAMCAMAQEKIYVYMSNGTTEEYVVANCDSISFTKPKPPTRPECQTALDVEDNHYAINSQMWLNVNTRCIEYDTESEAYKAGIKTIPTSSSAVYTPYYIDPTTSTDRPGYMSKEQWGKLGMLYNWAAAVGLADGQSQTTAFTKRRQGICPNGWHIPSDADWLALRDALGGPSQAGRRMRTDTGWSSGMGDGDFDFAALPAGYANGSYVENVGSNAYYWSSNAINSDNASYRYIEADFDTLNEDNISKKNAYSVRCLKN